MAGCHIELRRVFPVARAAPLRYGATMQPNTDERDYVLGTHDDEVKRLALQHRVWGSRMLDAFERAGLRLAALGRLSLTRAGEILRDFERRKGRAGIRCVTPLVLETIAVKRA
jgi:hypothetical protein